MVLIQLVKINNLKYNGNLSYIIIKYKNNTLGHIPTVFLSAEIRAE